jgi:hypothetical protein
MAKARTEFTTSKNHNKNRNENFYSKAVHKNRLTPQAKAPKAPIMVKNLSSIFNFTRVL